MGFIIFIIIGIVFLSIFGISVFLIKKSRNTNDTNALNTTVNFNLMNNSGNFSLNKNILINYTIGKLIETICKNAILNISDIRWTSLTINDEYINLTLSGTIDPNEYNEPLYNFLNTKSINNLTVVGNFCLNSLYPSQVDICKGETGTCSNGVWTIVNGFCPIGEALGDCCLTSPSGNYASCFNGEITCSNCEGPVPSFDFCNGEKPICTYNGWEVKKGYCPSGVNLYNCCSGSASGNYPSCNSDGTVSCGSCPDSITCTASCNDLLGPLCTATGWICASGYGCPESITSCCSGYGSCIENNDGTKKILCGCTGPLPTCETSCKMCGLVCSSTGSFYCAQGQICPDFESMVKCCTGSYPVPVCNPINMIDPPSCDSEKQYGITCTNCDSFPKPSCPQTCDGQSLVCTATGWICQSQTSCPTDNNVINSCCTGSNYYNLTPYCDSTSNTIKCRCPDGYNSCSNPNCSNFCCPNGSTCITDASNVCLCCETDRVCGDICCPAGSICNNGICVAPCGENALETDPIYCENEQSCIIVDGLTSNLIQKLKQEYNDNIRFSQDNTKAYMCTNKNSCAKSNETSVPASLNNYFPCLVFPTDVNGNVGYCIEKTNPNGTCYSKYKDLNSCNNDANCTWRDILTYMTQCDGNNCDMSSKANIIQNELNIVQNTFNGFYCDPSEGKTSYSRLVGYNLSNCQVGDCITQLSQAGINQIVYDEKSGNCAGIQTCGSLQNINFSIINSDGSITNCSTGSNGNCPINTNFNSDFLGCDKNTNCPADQVHLCVSTTGANENNFISNISPYPYTENDCATKPTPTSIGEVICKQVLSTGASTDYKQCDDCNSFFYPW